MPAAEVELSTELVRRLLIDQHPDLADRALTELANGWDNTMYRLGSDLTVRVPRRAQAAELVVNEQRWLPRIGPDLPLPTPIPVRVGAPTDYYPWAWSVLPWFEGTPIGVSTGLDHDRAADDLGRFLAALHRPGVADGPVNPGRGCALAVRNDSAVNWIETAVETEHRPSLLERWRRCLDATPWSGPGLWLHGDLHPMNVLQHRGVVSAVIDFGDITDGDPATDLAIGFSLFEGAHRERFRAAADSVTRPIDDQMWCRAEGWALSVGLAIIANSADNPVMYDMGRRMAGI